MDQVLFFLRLGFAHISDLAGYDHILFLVALCAVYRLGQWKSLAILVTAFTLGHSLTLALSSLDILVIRSDIVEFLIPGTIFATALYNVLLRSDDISLSGMRLNYLMALFFGFIHGMGFSNYFRALLMGESSVLIPLLGFNLGIEVGQLLVVLFVVVLSFCVMTVLRVKQRDWTVFVSGAAAGMSLTMMIEKSFW